MSVLRVEKFKCFKNVDIKLNQLTVFVGANGYGKSSAIQSILLLKQAIDSNNQKIYLNDIYGQNLGICSSVCNKELEESYFEVTINTVREENRTRVIFKSDTSENSSFEMSVSIIERGEFSKETLHYLSAERVGPRISHPLVHMDYLNTGVHGEYTAQVIARFSGRTPVDEKRRFQESKNKTLKSQVNYWIETIFPNVKINADVSSETLTAQLLIENEFSKDNFSTNIGFGISYVLPIITTCLVAIEGSYVLIENPEAHLHPAAQASMGRFLARMARSGLKIIVETHSDHILEGIQLFVAENKEWANNVSINCFAVDKVAKQPNIREIRFNQKAEFSEWPDGFMDQSQKDFVELLKIRGKV